MTITEANACPLFPAASVAEYANVTMLPGFCAVSVLLEMRRYVATGPSSESSAVADGRVNVSPASMVEGKFAGSVMTGAVRSITVTVRTTLRLFPDPSVATYLHGETLSNAEGDPC